MIILDFTYDEDKSTGTYEMKCVASGGNPFVKDDKDRFVNIASPADMRLLPDSKPVTGMWRDSEIAMLFRESATRDYTKSSVEKQVAAINGTTLAETSGAVLFSNIP